MPGTDWENSKACTPLKRDLLRAIFKIHTEFFLTGGSALGIFYLEHRILEAYFAEEIKPVVRPVVR